MFSTYQKQALTVMISALCTNCHDIAVILLNVALNTINLHFYKNYRFYSIFASYFPILMSFKFPQSNLFYITA
jgi:hypothetical protein